SATPAPSCSRAARARAGGRTCGRAGRWAGSGWPIPRTTGPPPTRHPQRWRADEGEGRLQVDGLLPGPGRGVPGGGRATPAVPHGGRHGDPNTAPEYAEALATLYPVAYQLKFASKTELGRDYVVPPL